jgi:hypothetical protein
VAYLRQPTNRGVADALAAGWEASDSTFTSFWGDDDYMLPRYLPLHLERAAEGFDVVSGSYYLAGPELEWGQAFTLPPVTFADLLADRVTANDGSLLRRSALDGIGLRPERERAMMLTLWLALAHAGRRFSTIEEPTWLYRRHAANMSGQLPLTPSPRFADLRRQAIADYAGVPV